MKDALSAITVLQLPLRVTSPDIEWLVIGGGRQAYASLCLLLRNGQNISITVIAQELSPEMEAFLNEQPQIKVVRKEYDTYDFNDVHFVIAATDNEVLNECIRDEAALQRVLVYTPGAPHLSDFNFVDNIEKVNPLQLETRTPWFQRNSEQMWRRLASQLVLAFFLMVLGHIIISYLPFPSVPEIWVNSKPYFDKQFLFFVLAGFLAQMVDGMLSMGYGVTSATCLISFGVNPVAVSAAIHTSEVFASGISGYSHYKFGNVNKKLFRHLVIPGVLGAILGAVMLVFLGEKAGKWLMPIMALYALFLGFKILYKAFQPSPTNKKVKRVGWLAGAGGFLDSFGGGGWGPIVTSSLIAKGRSPKYTIGSVSLTEFFVTLASALTFFVTVGVSHWNIVLGLLLGGGIAAPFAARLAGKLPRKTMMIAVGIMVMVWCIRMFIKSLS
ncbi:TSUP family transporter [Flavisolibacter tropicus]|nr:TSUP family transporter [Flavisolibacter tropicus]